MEIRRVHDGSGRDKFKIGGAWNGLGNFVVFYVRGHLCYDNAFSCTACTSDEQRINNHKIDNPSLLSKVEQFIMDEVGWTSEPAQPIVLY